MNDNIAKINVSKLLVNVFYDAKSRCSFCWKYFGHLIKKDENNKKRIINSDRVYCSACLSSVKKENVDITFGCVKIKCYNKTVSTGNLVRHLRDEHQIFEEQTPPEEAKVKSKDFAPPSKTSTSSTIPKKGPIKRDKLLLAKDMVLWFCRSLLPFDSIADDGLVDFFKKYDVIKNVNDVPSRQTISSTLSDLYESLLDKVKDTISNDAAEHVAMSFDIWTDHCRQLNYVTFTLHYLSQDFDLKTMNLSTELTSGEKINDAIADIKIRFGLDDKNIVAVTAASEYVKRAIITANMIHHYCLGHGLHNLMTVDGINSVPEIAKVIQKCKNVVKAVRYCVPDLQAHDEEDEQQQQSGFFFFNRIDGVVEMLEADERDPIPQIGIRLESDEHDFFSSDAGDFKQIPNSTPTRWHCILEMLESVIHLSNREHINSMLWKIGQLDLRITQTEWLLLEDLLKFLKSFREAVEVLSSQKTCTINVALVFRSEINDILNSIDDGESLIISRLKHNMMANLHKRFPITKPIVAAALLDNRFMSLKEIDVFLENNNMNRTTFLSGYIKEIISVNEMPEMLGNNSGNTSTNNKSDSLLQKLSKKHSINTYQAVQDDPIEQECWRYIAAADPTEPKDLLSFWKNKKEAYPYLSALAKSILCVPATSAPSERVFSIAGLNMNAKRSRLSPVKINNIIFIHDNYKLCEVDKVKR